MAPYNDETVYRENDDENTEIDYPEFTWDWYQIGGRYKAKLKLKADLNDEDFEIVGCTDGVIMNPMREMEDYSGQVYCPL